MTKKIPQYIRIAQDIIHDIQEGIYNPRDQIMTESQLCTKYNVSRMTVNKALVKLVTEGYVSRTAGKGTFVLEPKFMKLIGSNSSFSNDLHSINKTPGAILLNYQVLRASSIVNISEILHLTSDELVHKISRIRTSDGIRVALSNTYIPCKYLPSVDVTVLEGSFYDYLDKHMSIHPHGTDYSFNAILPSPEQKELLQTDSCALLKVCHTSSTENAPYFEYTETLYVGNRYTYKFLPVSEIIN